MLALRQSIRLLQINRVLVKHGLDEVIFATHLFRPFRFFFYLAPWNWFSNQRTKTSQAERIRCALEELGPIFVKFGQLLSTRQDLLPEDLATELAKLQDRVPAFDGKLARQIIETALDEKLEVHFSEFSEQALASASIAQVHAAKSIDGRDLVIKVLRPDVEASIARDMEILKTIAGLADRFWSEAKRLRPREVVAEYERTLLDELDLIREAASASLLRRNFANSELLYVPEVLMDLTRRNVMVMERIHGIGVSDSKKLKAANIDLQKLAERGVEIFFTQVFRDNFFHADMHPGNIFVAEKNPDSPQYIAVDFGIMGSLSNADQKYLAGNFLAFFNRDYRKVAQLHLASGWVPANTRVDEFESAIRTVCEPIFERPLKDISFGHLLLRLFQTARRFDMQIQPQLVLLQKTLLAIEGLGRQLYPELDLWKTAKPYLETWTAKQLGLRATLKNIKSQLPEWGEKLPELPVLAHEVLQQAKRGELKLQWDSPQLSKLLDQLAKQHKQKIFSIIGSSLLICGTLIFALDAHQPLLLSYLPVWSSGLAILGVILLLRAWPD